jgi:hypothetical protein
MLFIFDANYPHDFVKGFSIMEKANHRSTISVNIVFVDDFMGYSGAKDIDIIAKATLQNAVIVTHDSDFKRIKSYKPLLIQHQVGYIFFRQPSKYVYWDIVKAFVNKWDDIKLEVSQSTHPFAFEISKKGQLSKLQF